MSITNTVALYDTIHKAITEQRAMCITYLTGGTDSKARVVMPQNLHTTKSGADTIFAWDSIRQTEITLRVDRIAPGAHLLG